MSTFAARVNAYRIRLERWAGERVAVRANLPENVAACKALEEAVAALIASGESAVSQTVSDLLWETLAALQGAEFRTAKNLSFSHTIRGNEMFVTRKDKSITRATVLLAFRKAVELQQKREPITGPKKLGTFGASYLYPIFQRIGVIQEQQTV